MRILLINGPDEGRRAVRKLVDRTHLGIHSGTIGDGLAMLIEAGAVTNTRKGRDLHISVAGLIMGTRRLYDLVDQTTQVALRPVAYTHDAGVLGSLSQLTAINSAIEVDLTGAINCEVAAGRYVGAVGGALDFARGARASHGGVSVIALPSTAGPMTRIVPALSGPTTIGAAVEVSSSSASGESSTRRGFTRRTPSSESIPSRSSRACSVSARSATSCRGSALFAAPPTSVSAARSW